MKSRSILFYIYYFLGICFIAFIINSGSAWPAIWNRISRPSFPFFLIASALELWLIASYLSWFIRQKEIFGTHFTKQQSYYQQFLLITVALTPVIIIHTLLLQLLIMQKTGTSIFLTSYFKIDFWFFSIPLLAYSIYIFKFPKHRLYTLHNVSKSNYYKEFQHIDSSKLEPLNKSLAQQQSYENSQNMLLIWHITKNINNLRNYIKEVHLHNQNNLDNCNKVYEILLIQQVHSQYFALLTNSKKKELSAEQVIILLCNPWFTSIKQGTWLNMLHADPELAIHPNFPDTEKRWVYIDDSLWERLCITIPLKTRLSYLESSKEYRNNFLEFWEESNLNYIDENHLYELYE